jgi:hypothetical protein
VKDATYDDFNTEFQWPSKTCHVVGTPYGIVIVYPVGQRSDHTRMVFIYADRTYGIGLPKRYADVWNIRLARQFAKETVMRVLGAKQEAA